MGWEDCRGARTQAGLTQIIAPLLGFVQDGMEKGESVLIHCFAGAHRSGAAGIACMMHMQGVSGDDAFQAAKAKRPVVDLFSGMQKLVFSLERLVFKGEDKEEVISAAI